MISLLDPHQVGPHVVVEVTGEIDVTSASVLRDRLLALLNRGVDSLVVDLRGVTFVDSTGAGSLLRVFDLMQLTRRLHVTRSVAAVDVCCPALASVRTLVPPRVVAH